MSLKDAPAAKADALALMIMTMTIIIRIIRFLSLFISSPFSITLSVVISALWFHDTDSNFESQSFKTSRNQFFFQRGFSLIKDLCFEVVFLPKKTSRRLLPKPTLKVAKNRWKGVVKLFQLL